MYLQIALLVACAAGAIYVLWLILSRLRRGPEERERQRRLKLNVMGRMIDGLLTEVEDGVVFYRYEIAGVVYSTSQDIKALRRMVPRDDEVMIGTITLKYLPRNPANSIAICENWSGLRLRANQSVSAE